MRETTNELEKALNREMQQATSQEERYEIYERYEEMRRELERVHGNDEDLDQHSH